MNKQDKILERCKKLLAMANDPSSKEAEIALRRLQILMAKHNLSLGELEKDESEIDREDWHYGTSAGLWSRIIITAVAKLYFCQVTYFRSKQRESYFITGTEINRKIALEISQEIIKKVYRLANAKAKNFGNGKIDHRFKVSYRNGSAYRIQERCEDLIEKAKETGIVDEENGKAIVLRSLYDEQQEKIDQFFKNKGLNIKTTSRTATSKNKLAFRQGEQDANSAALRKEVKA